MSGKQEEWCRMGVMVLVCEEAYMGHSLMDELLILMRCHICELPQLYKALEGWKSVCGQAYNLKGIKGKISVFLLFLKLCFSFTVGHFMA